MSIVYTISAALLAASILTALLVRFVYNFIEYHSIYIPCDCVKISFNQFVAFYQSAPSKWELCDNYAIYSKDYGLKNSFVYFRSFYDYKRYKQWHRTHLEEKRRLARDKKLCELVKCWQEDINKNYQQAMEEVRTMYNDNCSFSETMQKNMDNIRHKRECR